MDQGVGIILDHVDSGGLMDWEWVDSAISPSGASHWKLNSVEQRLSFAIRT